MATGNHPGASAPRPIVQSSQPVPTVSQATSPPSKRDLTSWWKTFNKKSKKEEEEKGERLFLTALVSQLRMQVLMVLLCALK